MILMMLFIWPTQQHKSAHTSHSPATILSSYGFSFSSLCNIHHQSFNIPDSASTEHFFVHAVGQDNWEHTLILTLWCIRNLLLSRIYVSPIPNHWTKDKCQVSFSGWFIILHDPTGPCSPKAEIPHSLVIVNDHSSGIIYRPLGLIDHDAGFVIDDSRLIIYQESIINYHERIRVH